MPETDTLETIVAPRNLRAGTRILRRYRGGHECEEEWFTVLRWISPPRPAPGQPWASGFLSVRGDDGEAYQFGPSSLVIRDFEWLNDRPQKLSHRQEDEVSPVTKKQARFWWVDRD